MSQGTSRISNDYGCGGGSKEEGELSDDEDPPGVAFRHHSRSVERTTGHQKRAHDPSSPLRSDQYNVKERVTSHSRRTTSQHHSFGAGVHRNKSSGSENFSVRLHDQKWESNRTSVKRKDGHRSHSSQRYPLSPGPADPDEEYSRHRERRESTESTSSAYHSSHTPYNSRFWHNRRFRASSVRPFSPPRHSSSHRGRESPLKSAASLENIAVENDRGHIELELLEKEQERIRAQLKSLEEEEETCKDGKENFLVADDSSEVFVPVKEPPATGSGNSDVDFFADDVAPEDNIEEDEDTDSDDNLDLQELRRLALATSERHLRLLASETPVEISSPAKTLEDSVVVIPDAEPAPLEAEPEVVTVEEDDDEAPVVSVSQTADATGVSDSKDKKSSDSTVPEGKSKHRSRSKESTGGKGSVKSQVVRLGPKTKGKKKRRKETSKEEKKANFSKDWIQQCEKLRQLAEKDPRGALEGFRRLVEGTKRAEKPVVTGTMKDFKRQMKIPVLSEDPAPVSKKGSPSEEAKSAAGKERAKEKKTVEKKASGPTQDNYDEVEMDIVSEAEDEESSSASQLASASLRLGADFSQAMQPIQSLSEAQDTSAAVKEATIAPLPAPPMIPMFLPMPVSATASPMVPNYPHLEAPLPSSVPLPPPHPPPSQPPPPPPPPLPPPPLPPLPSRNGEPNGVWLSQNHSESGPRAGEPSVGAAAFAGKDHPTSSLPGKSFSDDLSLAMFLPERPSHTKLSSDDVQVLSGDLFLQRSKSSYSGADIGFQLRQLRKEQEKYDVNTAAPVEPSKCSDADESSLYPNRRERIMDLKRTIVRSDPSAAGFSETELFYSTTRKNTAPRRSKWDHPAPRFLGSPIHQEDVDGYEPQSSRRLISPEPVGTRSNWISVFHSHPSPGPLHDMDRFVPETSRRYISPRRSNSPPHRDSSVTGSKWAPLPKSRGSPGRLHEFNNYVSERSGDSMSPDLSESGTTGQRTGYGLAEPTFKALEDSRPFLKRRRPIQQHWMKDEPLHASRYSPTTELDTFKPGNTKEYTSQRQSYSPEPKYRRRSDSFSKSPGLIPYQRVQQEDLTNAYQPELPARGVSRHSTPPPYIPTSIKPPGMVPAPGREKSSSDSESDEDPDAMRKRLLMEVITKRRGVLNEIMSSSSSPSVMSPQQDAGLSEAAEERNEAGSTEPPLVTVATEFPSLQRRSPSSFMASPGSQDVRESGELPTDGREESSSLHVLHKVVKPVASESDQNDAVGDTFVGSVMNSGLKQTSSDSEDEEEVLPPPVVKRIERSPTHAQGAAGENSPAGSSPRTKSVATTSTHQHYDAAADALSVISNPVETASDTLNGAQTVPNFSSEIMNFQTVWPDQSEVIARPSSDMPTLSSNASASCEQYTTAPELSGNQTLTTVKKCDFLPGQSTWDPANANSIPHFPHGSLSSQSGVRPESSARYEQGLNSSSSANSTQSPACLPTQSLSDSSHTVPKKSPDHSSLFQSEPLSSMTSDGFVVSPAVVSEQPSGVNSLRAYPDPRNSSGARQAVLEEPSLPMSQHLSTVVDQVPPEIASQPDSCGQTSVTTSKFSHGYLYSTSGPSNSAGKHSYPAKPLPVHPPVVVPMDCSSASEDDHEDMHGSKPGSGADSWLMEDEDISKLDPQMVELKRREFKLKHQKGVVQRGQEALRELVQKATRSLKLQHQAEKKWEKLRLQIILLSEQARVAKKIARAHEQQKEETKKKAWSVKDRLLKQKEEYAETEKATVVLGKELIGPEYQVQLAQIVNASDQRQKFSKAQTIASKKQKLQERERQISEKLRFMKEQILSTSSLKSVAKASLSVKEPEKPLAQRQKSQDVIKLNSSQPDQGTAVVNRRKSLLELNSSTIPNLPLTPHKPKGTSHSEKENMEGEQGQGGVGIEDGLSASKSEEGVSQQNFRMPAGVQLVNLCKLQKEKVEKQLRGPRHMLSATSSYKFPSLSSLRSSIVKKSRVVSLTKRSSAPDSTSVQPSCPVNYTSPLLTFRSYRLSPYYRTREGLSFRSNTYSHKLNPHCVLCPYDIQGICNDDTCKQQHPKDYELSDKELLQDIVSYCPKLAGCGEGASTEEVKQAIVSYVDGVVSRHKGRMTTEQLCLWLSSQVKETAGLKNPHTVFPLPRTWTPEPKEEAGLSLFLNPKPSTRVIDAIRKEPPTVIDQDVVQGEEDVRYFAPDNTELLSLERAVLQDPTDAAMWQRLADKKLADPDRSARECMDNALNVLARGLEANRHACTLWQRYLALYCRHPEADNFLQFCRTGLEYAPSYDIWFLYLNSLKTYSEKDGACNQALNFLDTGSGIEPKSSVSLADRESQGQGGDDDTCLTDVPKSPTSTDKSTRSHQALEMILYKACLNLLSGRLKTTLNFLQSVLGLKSTPSTPLRASSLLTTADHLVLWLCYIHVLEWHQLPPDLYSPTDQNPGRLLSKAVTLHWPEARPLYSSRDTLIKLHKKAIRVGDKAVLDLEATRHYVQVVRSLFALLSLERPAEAVSLSRSVLSSRNLEEIWLATADLYASFKDKDGVKQVFQEAVKVHEHSAKLHFYWNSFLMSEGETEEALCNLEQFVINQFDVDTRESQRCDPNQLYGQLLGQQEAFSLQMLRIKPQAGGDEKHKNIYLWLCYSLLLELQGERVNTVEIYERSLTHAQTSDDLVVAWQNYIGFLLRTEAASPEDLHSLLSRSIISMPTKSPVPLRPTAHWLDYRHCNTLVEAWLAVLDGANRLDVAEFCLGCMPANMQLLLRVVELCLANKETRRAYSWCKMVAAQTEKPANLAFWRITSALAQEEGTAHEKDQMLVGCVEAMPLAVAGWKDLLLYEVSRENSEVVHRLLSRCLQLGVNIEGYVATISG
ncbi:uncharacterized protein LOC101847582 [Aplysia californica]|uniref:Uncharacterized protein LOC101847582 n=1 Tax=Aplysia californica TaxID=6500 RepID=A0ABM0JN90_APLCA|nr:uncharacterized protein LOC101847582 [Aplysia californica]